MSPAPIALFVYNRPEHTRRTVDALYENELALVSKLIIFSDAARNSSARTAVQEVRRYIRTISGFKSLDIIERTRNFGLASSIIDGVTEVANTWGRVIVLEDDMITSRHFLKFMNDGLKRYEADERVVSIHGYVYPVNAPLPETFFLRGADCWGWATWKDRWALFEPDGRMLLQQLRDRRLTHRFDLDGTYPFTRMLENQIRGRNNSWAIRWHASAFLLDKLTLYPGRSLVRNIGLDNSGMHCSVATEFFNDVAGSTVEINTIPVEENAAARNTIESFLRSAQPGMSTRILRKLVNLITRPH